VRTRAKPGQKKDVMITRKNSQRCSGSHSSPAAGRGYAETHRKGSPLTRPDEPRPCFTGLAEHRFGPAPMVSGRRRICALDHVQRPVPREADGPHPAHGRRQATRHSAGREPVHDCTVHRPSPPGTAWSVAACSLARRYRCAVSRRVADITCAQWDG
jgi:hypothetical protein